MKRLVAEAVHGVADESIWYNQCMTKLLEEGIKAVQGLPEERQNAAGEILLSLAETASSRYQLTPEQIADVKLAMAEADRGEFASDEEVAAMWEKFGV